MAALVHEHLVPGDDRALPVVQDEVLLGLVSIADVRTLPPGRWADTAVGAIMRGVEALSMVGLVEHPVRAVPGALHEPQ